MKKMFVTALAAVMSVTGLGVGATTAAPFVPQVQAPENSNIIQVQKEGSLARNNESLFLPRYRRNLERQRFDGRNFGPRSGFYTQGGQGWYNGHRGYRTYRRGYQRHGDWWFPAGAFIAGAIIGGALADPGPRYVDPYNGYYQPRQVRRVYRSNNYSNAHVQWCYNRYRSYDAYSNTFQPYHGPRQQCYSPYS